MADTVTFTCSQRDALMALWGFGRAVGLGALHSPTPPTDEQLQHVIDCKYVDYLAGKPMKFNLENWPNVNCLGYDRDNGRGAMAKVAQMLNESGPIPVGTGVTKKLNVQEQATVIAEANASLTVVTGTRKLDAHVQGVEKLDPSVHETL